MPPDHTPPAPAVPEKCPRCGAPGPLESVGADEHSAWHVTHMCDPYEAGRAAPAVEGIGEGELRRTVKVLMAAALGGEG